MWSVVAGVGLWAIRLMILRSLEEGSECYKLAALYIRGFLPSPSVSLWYALVSSGMLWYLRGMLWYLRGMLWYLRGMLWYLRGMSGPGSGRAPVIRACYPCVSSVRVVAVTS
jgi:hypothetical protein